MIAHVNSVEVLVTQIIRLFVVVGTGEVVRTQPPDLFHYALVVLQLFLRRFNRQQECLLLVEWSVHTENLAPDVGVFYVRKEG